MKAKTSRGRSPRPPTVDRASPSPMDELTWRELRQTLHEELERLPQSYRLPLILCYMEGQTQEEAARQLGWTSGVLKGRLDRGRALLRRRLTRRGLALAVPLLATSLSQNTALPAALVEVTARSATSLLSGQAITAGVSAHAAALARGGVKALVTRLRLGVVLALVVVAAGGGLAPYLAREAPRTPVPASEHADPPGPEASPTVRVDQHGDALPPRAVARVGSVRWWHGRDSHDCPLLFSPDGKSMVLSDQGAVCILD